MRRVGIYVRISKDRADEVSTDVQVKVCRDYARERGWQVVDTYTDRGRSAFKANVKRPAYDRLLDDLEAGAVDTLLVYRLDRMSRSLADFETVWQRIERAGGEFVSVSDGFDTTTAMGTAMRQIAGVFAQLESGIKSERIRDWHEHRAANGAAPTGPRAFGYGPGREVVKDEATLIRDAARQVNRGASLRSIVADWNGRGVTTANGKPWSSRALRHVLTNPHTAGLRVIDDVLVEGDWQPVLRRSTWEQVVEVLNDPARRSTTGPTRKHLLSGIARCASCGTPMGVKPNSAGPRYTCLPRAGHDACGKVSIAVADTDTAVRDAVRDAIDRGDLDAQLVQHDAPALVASLEADLEALAADHGAGTISRAEWQAARAGLQERLDVAREQAARPTPLRADVRRFATLPVAQQRVVVGWALNDLRVRPADRSRFGTFDESRLVYDWRS